MSLNDLCDEYVAWTAAQGLPALSADELLHELWAKHGGLDSAFIAGPVNHLKVVEQLTWLSRFMDRWQEEVESEETGAGHDQ